MEAIVAAGAAWLAANGSSIGNVVLAFVIGGIGSAAYLATLVFRFATGPLSDQVMPHLLTRRGRLVFTSIGGLVAVVFQMPQLAQLSPIQAFVLGITWPMLVNQYIAGQA